MEMVVLLSKQKPVPHTTKCALRKGQLKVDQDDHIGEESVGACVGGGTPTSFYNNKEKVIGMALTYKGALKILVLEGKGISHTISITSFIIHPSKLVTIID